MDSINIQLLEKLVSLSKGSKISTFKVHPLTSPGDNYGSVMLSVVITVESPDGNRQISAVAKLVPPDEVIQYVFNTPVTFRNEVAFYKTIVPLLQQFQREQGVDNVIDYFPECYGSRINSHNDESDVADLEAVLLLENLKASGFVNIDRTIGYDLATTKLIVTDLARFHATALALKLQKPHIFETKIKPFLYFLKMTDLEYDDLVPLLKKITSKNEEIKPFMDRILTAVAKTLEPSPIREPWTTITHSDCWINNIMTQLDNGTCLRNKFIDFQMIDFASPANDIIFFLFSNVQIAVIERFYEDLITLYHTVFTTTLEQLKCDTNLFSIQALKEELDFAASHSQFGHVACMIWYIFAPKKTTTSTKDEAILRAEPTEIQLERFYFVVREFLKRKWI